MTLKVSTAQELYKLYRVFQQQLQGFLVIIISCRNFSYIGLRRARDTKFEFFFRWAIALYKPYVRGSVMINDKEREFPGTKVFGYENSMNLSYHRGVRLSVPSVCPSITSCCPIKIVHASTVGPIKKSPLWAVPRNLVSCNKISCHWVLREFFLNEGVKERHPLKVVILPLLTRLA